VNDRYALFFAHPVEYPSLHARPATPTAGFRIKVGLNQLPTLGQDLGMQPKALKMVGPAPISLSGITGFATRKQVP